MGGLSGRERKRGDTGQVEVVIAVTMRFTILMSHMWGGFGFASSAGLSLLDGRNDIDPIDGQGQSPRFDEQRAPLKLRECSPLEAPRFLGAASIYLGTRTSSGTEE